MLWIYFISGFYLPTGIRALGWICRVVAFIIWGKQAILMSLGLPATDLPSTLCCLIFYERIFIVYNQKKLENHKLLQIILIYIFAVQLKLSQIFMVFPLLALLYSFRKDTFLSDTKIWWRYLVLGFAMFFPWALRTYLLSGCWLFPIAKSCFPVASWSLPLPGVQMIKYYIQSWAKVPRGGAQVEAFSDWLPSWVQMQWSKPHFQILILSALVLFFLMVFKNKLNQKDNEATDILNRVSKWFYISLALVFLIWFFQAPDPRFIMGSFIFLQGLIFHGIFKIIKVSLKSPRLLIAARVVGFIGLGVYFLDLSRICKNSITRYPFRADRFSESDLYSMEKKESLHGVRYLIPDMNKDTESGCWLTLDLCANHIQPLLFKTNFGSYTVFESKEEGGHD